MFDDFVTQTDRQGHEGVFINTPCALSGTF